MKNSFNFRPDNWKKIDLKHFFNFITSYAFTSEYRQLYKNEDNPGMGIMPSVLFFLIDKSSGVAVIKNIETDDYNFFSFGKNLKTIEKENIAYNDR